MIGSVHGCVSCPVVVKPWQPQSLSRPQHPLPPSHGHPQSHPYSLPQRSSSVHPLTQSTTPDDKTRSSSLSPQRLPSTRSHHRSRHQSGKAEEEEISAEKNGSPRKTAPANGSPKKTGSPAGSPKKMGSTIMSQHDFAEQYEKLLEPRKSDVKVANISSQYTQYFQPVSHDARGDDLAKGVFHVESQVKPSEPVFSPPKPAGTATKQRRKNKGPKSENLNKCADPRKELSKDQRESTPTQMYLPDGSKVGSPPQLSRINFSPTPLPSITQRRSKTAPKQASPLEHPWTMPPLLSFRPSKGLPSISNPRLQAMRNRMTPPPPSLCLTLERKRHSLEHGGKDGGDCLVITSMQDPFQCLTLDARREAAVQSHQSAAVLNAHHNPCGARTVAAAVPNSCEPFESGLKAKQDTGVAQTTQFSATSPTEPSWEAPTPDSLDSSNWSLSFGQTAVAPGVDALTTAAAAGDMMKVKALLADGVDVNAVNTFGRTAIQVMTHDNTDLAEVLLRHGADPNVQDKGRRAANSTYCTIAHDVAASGYTDTLRCLLRHGADVNLQDRWGNTPLHIAAKEGHLATVRLLRRGSSLYLPNQQGKTPMMLLEAAGNSAAKQWIKLKKTTVSRLQVLCVLAVRRELGPRGLRCWRKHAPRDDVQLQRQVLLQSRGGRPPPPLASASTLLSSRHSAGSRSLQSTRGQANGGGRPVLPPGLSAMSRHVAEFLSLTDLVPRRLSTGENTSLEVQNTSSGQSNDDLSLGAHATSSLASETGSLFETNLSSIGASHSADELSLPSLDQSV